MIRRLQGLPIRAQVFSLLLAAPLVVALLGLSLTPVAVEVAMVGEGDAAIQATARAVRVSVAVVVLCGVIAAFGAAALLRGSIDTLVGRMLEATDALAHGRFRHRIASARRDELGSLAGAIDEMAERLERLEAARRRMLASVSHELRTPLTIIRGHAYTLSRDERDGVRRSHLDVIDHEVMRLDALVEELVDASSLQAGGVQLDLRACSLADMATATARRFDVAAAERGVAIGVDQCAKGVSAVLDVPRFHQVLGNLVANAVRHADPGTRVSIEIDYDELTDQHQLRVRNRGAAIDPAVAERIFEPFEQVGERPGRVGLGLAIARGIVEAHGGQLQLGAGADPNDIVFVVVLPRRVDDRIQQPVRHRSARMRPRSVRGARRMRRTSIGAT